MGPSSEGSRVHERGNKDPSARVGAPARHLTPPPSLACTGRACTVSVCVCEREGERERNVCVPACISRQVLPLGISALWISAHLLKKQNKTTAQFSANILQQANSPCNREGPTSIFMHGFMCITMHALCTAFWVRSGWRPEIHPADGLVQFRCKRSRPPP